MIATLDIIRGAPSVGFGSSRAQSPTLPLPQELPSQAEIIADLTARLANIETVVEGKADANKIRTLIAYSDEAVLIKAQDIVLAGTVTIAKIINEQNGTTSGEVPESITRIIGDRIQTGAILSTNWGSAAGTSFDLDDGTLVIGGSSAPALLFDGTDLFVAGTITAGSVIATTVTVDGVAIGDIKDAAEAALPAADFGSTLQSSLDAGVANIVAGTGGDYALEVLDTYIIAKHSLANPSGLGAGYSGDLRTGVILSSNGIGMGHNRKSDGAWINAVSISSTGDVSVLGTLSAGSVIVAGVEIDGVDASDVVANAEAGKDLSDALLTSGTTVLKGIIQPTDSGAIKIGTITWNATTGALTGGTGVALTEWGIIGAASGVATFTIDAATGSPVFAGSLSAASGTFAGTLSAVDGTFEGDLVTSGQVYATGSTSASWVDAAIVGEGTGTVKGVAGQSDTGSGVYGNGGIGVSGTGTDIGVSGAGTNAGGDFRSTNGVGINVVINGASGKGLSISGTGSGLNAGQRAIEVLDGVVYFAESLEVIGDFEAYDCDVNSLETAASIVAGTVLGAYGNVVMYGASANLIVGNATSTGAANIVIKEGSAGAKTADQIQVYAQNSTSSKATLAIVSDEDVVSGTGPFAGIAQVKILWNAVEYWLPLNAV